MPKSSQSTDSRIGADVGKYGLKGKIVSNDEDNLQEDENSEDSDSVPLDLSVNPLDLSQPKEDLKKGYSRQVTSIMKVGPQNESSPDDEITIIRYFMS